MDRDSLNRISTQYLSQALAVKSDFPKQRELAKKAAQGFEVLGQDSLLFEARYLAARAAHSAKDSSAFVKEFQLLKEHLLTFKDTSAWVKTYNLEGSFYFSQGNIQAGIEAFKKPDSENLYAASSLEENVFNLGALVDIGLSYTKNLDTVYYYVNKLQQLARIYPAPSVQVVSRFKLAQLFTKAYNYEEALEILRGAYPYLQDLNNNGFSHFYYRNLIQGFIHLGMPDSAQFYIQKLVETASYPEGDPRNCYAIVSNVRALIDMDKLEELPQEFEVCYQQQVEPLTRTQKASVAALEVLHAKCAFLVSKKRWTELDEILPMLIKYAGSSQSNPFLARAYDMKYRSLVERGISEGALEAHIKFKEYTDLINKYVFSQSETLIRNQHNLQLIEEENKVLQVENQNQRLRLTKDRSVLLLFVAGLLLLGTLVTYFFRLSYIRAQQSKELSRLVKERTDQLQQTNLELMKTNDDLLESNAELERFAFIASHDLKTPLHNIIKFSGLLKRKLEPTTSQDIKDYLSFIIQGGKRMNYLIEDVLEYSKLSRQENGDNKVQIDLNNLVDEISRSISEYLYSRNATIEISTPLPSIIWSHAKIFMLLKNLIENGVKYNQSAKPTIKLEAFSREGGVDLAISDNGIGIAEEYFDKIFLMFTRLHNQTEYEGSGLGLATCKKIVEEFGGSIRCEGHAQGGTTFRIRIPQDILVADQLPTGGE
ncbi:MAG: hypothetical protein F6K19_39600 [Cyanothece sp. SIO1E1]|nr:hypothetical protein [Cyanothece sp. SIO1E1]